MDTTTTIIGVCLFLLFIVPIILVTYKSKRKILNLKTKFDELVLSNNLHLTDQDDINGKLIGIDAAKKTLLFVSPDILDVVKVDLNKKVIPQIVRDKEIGQLDLVIKIKNNHEEKETRIPFFNSDKDSLLHFDYFGQKAEKWLVLINSAL